VSHGNFMNKHFLFGSKYGESVHCSLLLRLKLFLSVYAKFWKAAVSFVMSVCVCVCLSFLLCGWKNSAPTEKIFIIFDIRTFFEHLSRKFSFYYNLARMTVTLHDDEITFLIIFLPVLPIMRFGQKMQGK